MESHIKQFQRPYQRLHKADNAAGQMVQFQKSPTSELQAMSKCCQLTETSRQISTLSLKKHNPVQASNSKPMHQFLQYFFIKVTAAFNSSHRLLECGKHYRKEKKTETIHLRHTLRHPTNRKNFSNQDTASAKSHQDRTTYRKSRKGSRIEPTKSSMQDE